MSGWVPAPGCKRLGSRALSLAEVLVASLVVLGHSVWRVSPNSVPILLVAALVSFRLREGGWRAMGLARPRSWGRTLLSAAAAALAVQLIGQFITDPLVGPRLRASAGANPLQGVQGVRDGAVALRWLLVIWTYAAFGEEIGYRGYVLNRVADLGRHSRAALLAGLVWSSILFGCAHWYQGPAGVVGNVVSGLVLGAAYLLSGRNLWVAIPAHGASDTLALAVAYLGLPN